jgi:fructokinase
MIVSCGEALVDFLPGTDRDGRPAYRPANGGSLYNVAIGLGRLGIPAGFLGGISTDFFGDALVRGLEASGVSTRYVARLDRPTTLAFVSLGGDEPQYAFYDAESADRHWSPEANPPLGDDVGALHFGSISLLREPAADRFAELMASQKGGRFLSLDLNVRPGMIDDPGAYRRRLEPLIAAADLVKASTADLDWFEPGRPVDDVAEQWLAGGSGLVVITRGAEGASAFGHAARVDRPARPIRVVDTVGAGDSFMAGLLAALEDEGRLSPGVPSRLAEAELDRALDFAMRVAALTCGRAGADPPRREEL